MLGAERREGGDGTVSHRQSLLLQMSDDKIRMSVMITVWVHTLPVYPSSDALTELLDYFHCCTVSCFHNYLCVYHGEINTSSCCFIISLRGS